MSQPNHKIAEKIYFASDFHLGAPDEETSSKREKLIVNWLDQASKDAKEIYLVGDIFDFWFEYKHTIPKGFVRLQGKIAEITDKGVPVNVFTGNHDMWIFDYLPKELGITLHKEPILKTYNGKNFFIGHGDGLGPGDKNYKRIKKIFSSKLCQWAFSKLHPNIGMGMARFWSKKSRENNPLREDQFLGEDKEWLLIFCRDYLKKNPNMHYFIFGHRHLPLDIKLSEKSRYINLGEWIKYNTYAIFDGNNLELKEYSTSF